MPVGETNQQERVSVVIPAYNEEARIAQVITDLRQKVPGVDILVVSDLIGCAHSYCSIDFFNRGVFGVAAGIFSNTYQSFGGVEI